MRENISKGHTMSKVTDMIYISYYVLGWMLTVFFIMGGVSTLLLLKLVDRIMGNKKPGP
jgi:hypothetical protein